MASKRLTVVNEQTGEVEQELKITGGYNILYTNHEDDGTIRKILRLKNARFGKKSWIMNEWYEPIAKALIEKFDTEFKHLKKVKFLFLEDREWEPQSASWNWKARIKKASEQFKEATGYDYIIETRQYYIEEMTREQRILLIYHEIRHIGADGKLIHHDIEDWNNIVATFGREWHERDQELIDILDNEFDKENWMQVLPTRRQLTLFEPKRV